MPESVQAYTTQRTIEGVEYALERRLPVKGKVMAKLGDTVKPETVVAEGKVSAGFRIFRLGQLLGVPAHKAKNYLRRTIGSRVYRGDIIAEAPKLFGLRQVQFLAPVDGILQEFNPDSGQLTMQFAPTTQRLPAGLAGTISQIIPDQGVYVQTQVGMLFGAFSTGQPREGALHLVAATNEPISPASIDTRLAGHVVAGGSLVTKDVIHRCLAIGVRGIVTGGISASDLLEISGRLDGTEDIGLTLLITSGLGSVAMEEETYQFLQAYQEQQVFLVPKEKMLVVPTQQPGQASKTVQDLPGRFTEVASGQRVRILAGEHVGQLGTVDQVTTRQPSKHSTITVPHCLLSLPTGDKIEIPATNIEIITNSIHDV